MLKPYQLNYQAILSLIQNEELNQISELEIDVEQCDELLLEEIISGLYHIKKLRLYHMEKFKSPALLVKNLTPKI